MCQSTCDVLTSQTKAQEALQYLFACAKTSVKHLGKELWATLTSPPQLQEIVCNMSSLQCCCALTTRLPCNLKGILPRAQFWRSLLDHPTLVSTHPLYRHVACSFHIITALKSQLTWNTDLTVVNDSLLRPVQDPFNL